MKWIERLLGLKEPVRHSPRPTTEQPLAVKTSLSAETIPPADWSDIGGWNRYLQAKGSDGPFNVPTLIGAQGWQSVRFLSFVKERGGRVWFPGCGIDPGPRFYAYVGCAVLATDFSPVAVRVQQKFAALAPETMFADWSSFVDSNALFERSGRFEVAGHDFTTGTPTGVFDVVINCHAFQGLSPTAMNAAGRHFYAALRPGGAAIMDTINVQGKARDVLEDSLIDAGFFIPFSASERWYRAQLERTGIIYEMVLGHPLIPYCEQCPAKHFHKDADRDRNILESFRAEYEARLAAEEPSVRVVLDSPETIVAHVVYATG
jgi:hypothetical protein